MAVLQKESEGRLLALTERRRKKEIKKKNHLFVADGGNGLC